MIWACKACLMFPRHRNVRMAGVQAGLSGNRERMMMGSLGRKHSWMPAAGRGGWQSREPGQHLPRSVMPRLVFR